MMLASTLALGLPFIISSCGGDGGGLGNSVCGGDLSAKITSLTTATASLTTRATAIENEVLLACEDIIVDLGGTKPARTGTLDAQVQAACNLASTEIQTELSGTTISLAISPPRCYVDASAQFTCEADCQVSGSCQPGTVDVRCSPGDLSVVCSGVCEANATCEATVTTPVVECDGTCSGVCMGNCSGSTNAAGECTGTCFGQCEGSCTLRPGSAGVTCGGSARCRGGCSVTGTAPQCEGELTPPTCDVEADCQAGCEAEASFEATCEPGAVTVSGGSVALQNTLEANLPTILKIRDGLAGLYADASVLATTAQQVGVELQGVPACALVQANQLITAANGALAAAASVQVTVSVSVSVSASATAN